jgi:hypothetical protein
VARIRLPSPRRRGARGEVPRLPPVCRLWYSDSALVVPVDSGALVLCLLATILLVGVSFTL